MTAHAYELIAARQDEPLDPGADAFLQGHLKACAECRRYERTVAHVDRLLRMREPALAVPPFATTGRARGSQRALFAAAFVLMVFAVGLATGAALREFRSPGPLQGASAQRVHPSDLDACELIRRAAPRAGYWIDGAAMDHGSFRDDVPTHACAWGPEANQWASAPHLIVVTRVVRDEDVSMALEKALTRVEPVPWRRVHQGKWIALMAPAGEKPFSAVAIFDEPYFFIVTYGDEAQAERLAEVVRDLLGSR